MPKTILIADDEAVIITLLTVNLELEGYKVVACTNGAEAVEKARKDKPDLAIFDIMMPKMDGLTAKTEMQKHAATRDIPIIFLSAKAQRADAEKGYAAGAAEYVTKPFDPTDLLEIVEGVLAGTYVRKDRR